MRLIDVNGNSHPMTKYQVRMMMLLGWVAFLFAWVMNILFYKVHPSAVDFSPKRFKDRCFLYVVGKKMDFFSTKEGKLTFLKMSLIINFSRQSNGSREM